jgi:hypothetical protein
MWVHQIWYSGDVPSHRKVFMDSVRAMCDHGALRYRLWSEADLPQLPVSEATIAAHPDMSAAAKSDLMRHEVVLLHGGAYFDTNIQVLQGATLAARLLEPLAEGKDAVYCNAGETAVIHPSWVTNSFFSAPVPGAPVVAAALREATDTSQWRRWTGSSQWRADWSTGQRPLGRAVAAHRDTVVLWPAGLLYPYKPGMWPQDRCVRWKDDGTHLNASGWHARGRRFDLVGDCAAAYPDSLAVDHWDLGGSWAPWSKTAIVGWGGAVVNGVLLTVAVVVGCCAGWRRPVTWALLGFVALSVVLWFAIYGTML